MCVKKDLVLCESVGFKNVLKTIQKMIQPEIFVCVNLRTYQFIRVCNWFKYIYIRYLSKMKHYTSAGHFSSIVFERVSSFSDKLSIKL